MPAEFVRVVAVFAALFALVSLPICAADVTLHGRVVDENDAPVRAARVTASTASTTVASTTPAQSSPEAQTDPDGAFELTLPGPGDFLVSVEREGYYALKDRAVHVETTQELTLVINSVREVFQSSSKLATTRGLRHDEIALGASGAAEDTLQTEAAKRTQHSGDMAVGSRALNAESLSRGHQRLAFQHAAEAGDLSGGPVKEIGPARSNAQE
jgi:hypothetical protein